MRPCSHRTDTVRRRHFVALFVGAFLALFAWSSSVRAETTPSGQVIIVGEGPVGLVTAIRLKMENPAIPVTIYEKRAENRPGRPQTPLLDQKTVDLLHDAGFDANRLIRIQSKTMIQPDGKTQTTMMPPLTRLAAEHAGKPPGDSVAAISTGDLEAELRTRAAKLGIVTKYDVEVRRATTASNGLVELETGAPTARGATPTPGTVEKARFVFFADGPSGHGASIANRQTIATMPMTGAITPAPADGKNLVVRTHDAKSGETVSVSRLASGQIIAQLPRHMTDATPAEKNAYLVKQLPHVGVEEHELGTRLNFSGELAHGGTGRGNVLVVGDATGAVPIVTSANLAIHIPLAVKMASTVAKLYASDPLTSARELEGSHKQWTATLFKTREEVTAPVRTRLTDVQPKAAETKATEARPTPAAVRPAPVRTAPVAPVAPMHH